MKIKFKFYLKSGKVFDTIDEVKEDRLTNIIRVCKTCMREGVEGQITFSDCCVRMSDVSVMEWEVLE